MSRLKYATLIDEVKDRLNYYTGRNIITAQERSLLFAPVRIARATTEGLLQYVQMAHGETIPHLLEDLTLTSDRTHNKVKAYRFPEQAFSERGDNGFLTIILDEVELDWEEKVSVQEVEHRAKSNHYGRAFPSFAADVNKRRFYAPDQATLQVQIIRMPSEVSSSHQEKYHGASIKVTAAPSADGDITVSDGTNDLTVSLVTADTIETSVYKIIAAINASDDFYYQAEKSGADTVILSRLERGPLNPDLSPSVTDSTTNIATTITDIGTQYLPLDHNYLDGLSEYVLSQLVSLSIPGSDQDAQQEPENQKS